MSDTNNSTPLEYTQANSTAQKTPTMPDNNLVWAILCTVMCCVPLGVVAIIKATEVEKYWAQGEYEKAQKAADDAKKWSLIGAASIAILLVLYFIVIGICFLLGYAADSGLI